MMNNIFCSVLIFMVFGLHLYFCFEYSPFTLIVNEKSQFQLLCSAFHKGIKIKWLKYNSDFIPREVSNDRYHTIISSNGTLQIKYFQEKQAYYQCITVFENKYIFEKIFQIISIGKFSKIFRNYSNKSVKLTKPLTYTSDIYSNETENNNPLIWLMWNDNKLYNISIIDNTKFSNRAILDRLPIVLNNLDLSFLACLVSSDSNTILSCGQPHFIRSSKLDRGVKVLYAAIKDGVILRCDENTSKTNEYVWYKNGHLIPFGESLQNYGSYVFIPNVTADDFGYYQCFIRKPFLMPYTLSIFLVNFYNSSLFQSVMKIIHQENSNILLPCRNLSTKIPKQIFGNIKLNPQIFVLSDLNNAVSNLNIISSDFPVKNVGFYQCFIYYHNQLKIFSFYSRIRNQKKNQYIQSKVLKKRSVNELNLEFKYTAFSHSIRIDWSLPSVPVHSYTIHWGNMYPGPSKKVINGKETKFVVESLQPETNYFFKIDSNFTKSPPKSFFNTVMTKKENKEIVLSIPVNLKVVVCGDTWSKISWDYRENGDSVNKTLFQIEYSPTRAHMNNKSYMNVSATEINIRNLLPATSYEIMVRNCLINSSKCSDWSMVLDFTTQETKPSDSPQQLTLSLVPLKTIPADNGLNDYQFAVQVSWQPPNKPNGEIKSYLILMTVDKKLDTDNWVERTVGGKSLNTVIDRLDINKFYYFRIACTNDHGKSPLSAIRIFKTPDKFGKNGGPIILLKDYYDAMEINEELKIQTSSERGNDNVLDINNNNPKENKKSDKVVLTNYKWWIIIGIVVGATLVFILIILFLVASKCRNDNNLYGSETKGYNKKICDMDYRKQTNEVVKFVNKAPILTTPDLFRHTNDQNCHQNYLEMEDRTESPNSFSSNKGFPSQNHQTFANQQNYRGMPGHYTPPGLIHQPNIVMTTSQLTSNSNERQFYQVPFLHHVFTTSAPRVNAAASDFNSINIPSPISGYSDFTSSQATVLYDTSTAKSSGGKSSLSGSGSYNNGLANKNSLVNEPINEGYSNPDNTELKNPKSSDVQHLISAFSSEELSQEMANLEGLMKDLNSITQKEFEC